MIFASGFVEADDVRDVEGVVRTLKDRGVEVSDINEEKIVFLVEKESLGEVKNQLDSFRDIEGVRSVYLTYYSLEEADRE
ncbi:MAG: chaperone NapD [Nitrospirae bacterium]|nr:chaperone NapD [Nitrospirota bacterium]